MGKLTTHVLNLATGTPAARMRGRAPRPGKLAAPVARETLTDAQGRSAQPLLAEGALRVGRYALTFHVAEYFRAGGFQVTEPPFLDEVVITFGVADASQNYHIPLLTTLGVIPPTVAANPEIPTGAVRFISTVRS